MRKLCLFLFGMMLFALSTISASKLMGQTVKFDEDANAYYVHVFPDPLYWDTTLNERKILTIVDVDTLSTTVRINWQTLSESGRYNNGAISVARSTYEKWAKHYIFTYVATKIKMVILND